jgi:hypothetical protein
VGVRCRKFKADPTPFQSFFEGRNRKRILSRAICKSRARGSSRAVANQADQPAGQARFLMRRALEYAILLCFLRELVSESDVISMRLDMARQEPNTAEILKLMASRRYACDRRGARCLPILRGGGVRASKEIKNRKAGRKAPKGPEFLPDGQRKSTLLDKWLKPSEGRNTDHEFQPISAVSEATRSASALGYSNPGHYTGW